MPENESKFESDLHPKHEQSMVSAYNDLEWLLETMSANQMVEVPAHLRGAKRSLESVLTECGVLEHFYFCIECEYSGWLDECASGGHISCPECDEPIQPGSTRGVDE